MAGLGVGEAVAALPGCAAVLGGEDTRRRDADPELLGVSGSERIVCRTRPAAPGFQLAAEGCSVRASSRSQVRPLSRLRSRLAGLVPAYSRPCAWHSDRSAEAVAEGQRRVGPADHSGEVRVVGRPVVHLALGEPGDLPALSAVVRAPNARAVPVAAAAGPDRPCRPVADDVVDRPAVAVRTRHLPAAAVVAAGDQEGALGRPDEDRDVIRSHGVRPPTARSQRTMRHSGRLEAGLVEGARDLQAAQVSTSTPRAFHVGGWGRGGGARGEAGRRGGFCFLIGDAQADLRISGLQISAIYAALGRSLCTSAIAPHARIGCIDCPTWHARSGSRKAGLATHELAWQLHAVRALGRRCGRGRAIACPIRRSAAAVRHCRRSCCGRRRHAHR